mmetsp:Transcript_14620/g.19090  ORF Transcript_14620/g.19090 Transcript_14620/m.19090 type:complete len:323 (-) Transcript_14620:273-1241(-)|eukprot:CAMPEP_0116056574 /NCGR_PEP_ID=MMETSP0322-20121206/4102_1 /TAXON_ID=163516 /ORGANISM="Leptocylindrus danicus var. apora, Strain B651" /LENGTH=322 /DNA_ID=CAMNT_0003540431 /DNA_START=29 /DNA_END=997 /DNA_ORIENTATION=-
MLRKFRGYPIELRVVLCYLVLSTEVASSFVRPGSWKSKLTCKCHGKASIKLQNTLTSADIEKLATQDYTVIPNFISEDLVDELAKDVTNLRSKNKFKVARIGQDSTNALNQEIRVAETCFLGEGKLGDVPSPARNRLYEALNSARTSLSGNTMLDIQNWQTGEVERGAPALDRELTEMLYAYYPSGGFYRRHRDAIPGSASVLRCYSLLLYLNKNWSKEDKGELRMHFDSGGDELPEGDQPSFVDIEPKAGTLVLFKSEKVPHEVLNTNSERLAVVGWYNRAPTVADVNLLASEDDQKKVGLLLISALLTVIGLVGVLSGGF